MLIRILSTTKIIALSCFAFTTAIAADNMSLTVEGNVASSCELNIPNSNISNLNLTQSGSQNIPFTVDCNAPFAYAIVSSNGGFKNAIGGASVVSTSATFTSLIPYTINTNFSIDTGSTFGDIGLLSSNLTATNAAPCIGTVFNATNCPFTNSGTGAAAAGLPASLTVFWNQTTAAPLVGGSFSDTLTLTVRIKS